MRFQIFGLCLSAATIIGCSSIHDSNSSTYSHNPLCARIDQRLAGSATEQIPSYRTVTETERADLLQEYSELGCGDNSDDEPDINEHIRYISPKNH